MKAPTTKIRFAEAQKLLDYGFNNFSFKKFGKKGEIIQSVSVNKGTKSSVNLVLEKDAGTLLEKGNDKEIEQTIKIDKNISAPIYKRSKIWRNDFFFKR